MTAEGYSSIIRLRLAPALGWFRLNELSRDHIAAFYSAMRDHDGRRASAGSGIAPLVSLAVYTGMRRSELLGLRWGDVNLRLGTLTIRRGLHVLRGGHVRYEPPKSRHGRRLIELSPAAVAGLQSHRENMVRHAEALGLLMTDETQVFMRPDFQPMLPDSVSAAFRKIAEKAGLGRIGYTFSGTHMRP